MGMVQATNLIAARTTALPSSSQGVTMLAWCDELRGGGGSTAGTHLRLSANSDPTATDGFVGSYRSFGTNGLYLVHRRVDPSSGYEEATITTQTGLVGIAVISDATNVRSYFKAGRFGALTAGGTVTATSFTPASLGFNNATNVALGNWSLYNRVLTLDELDRAFHQRANTIPGAIFYASGIGSSILTDESGNGNISLTSGSEAAHATDPGVPWRLRRYSFVDPNPAIGSGGSVAAAQATAATGKSTSTAFGATAQAAQVTAATGAATSTSTGATTQAAQLTAATGASESAGSGGSVAAAQVTAGKGIGNEGTGEGGSTSAAQATAATGQGIATGTGGSSSATQASAGKGATTHTGKGATANPAQVTAATGAVEAVGSGGSAAAPQETSGYNPGGQPTSGNGMARRRLPPRDY